MGTQQKEIPSSCDVFVSSVLDAETRQVRQSISRYQMRHDTFNYMSVTLLDAKYHSMSTQRCFPQSEGKNQPLWISHTNQKNRSPIPWMRAHSAMQWLNMRGDDLDFAKDSDSDQPGTTQEDPRNAFMFGLSIHYPTWHGDVFVKCVSLSTPHVLYQLLFET